MHDEDLPEARGVNMVMSTALVRTLLVIPHGRYLMSVTEDDASLQFPPAGLSFRCEGKLFVIFPAEENNQSALGATVPQPDEAAADPSDVPDNYAAPEWDEDQRIHNWRNHVPGPVRVIWPTFSDSQQRHIAAWANDLACAEEWE